MRVYEQVLELLHLFGRFDVASGMLAQIFVLWSALKRKATAAAVQSVILMAALGCLGAAVLLRPPSKPDLLPDLIASVGGILLLTPGVQAIRKYLKHREEQQAE